MMNQSSSSSSSSDAHKPDKLDNPLDTSERFAGMMHACRLGDLKRVQELISEGVNPNGKDEWDYTPLIVASLCGHYELVQLLLEAGALAERHTFQGERCIYGALNNKIRNLLLRHDYTKSTDPWVYWSTHLTSLLARTFPRTADVAVAASSPLQLHRFVLAARVPSLGRALRGAPPPAAIPSKAASVATATATAFWEAILPPSVPYASARAALRWLYLSEDAAGPATDQASVAAGVKAIAEKWDLPRLGGLVESSGQVSTSSPSDGARGTMRETRDGDVAAAMGDFDDFFSRHVVGAKRTMAAEHLASLGWTRDDNPSFADIVLRADIPDPDMTHEIAGPCASSPPLRVNSLRIDAAATSHLRMAAGGPQPGSRAYPQAQHGQCVVYPAHKAMLLRSPYFETMFSLPFSEGRGTQDGGGGGGELLPVVTVDAAPEVLEVVLRWLYTERVNIPLDIALDTLYAADMLLLDKLKNKAAVAISALGTSGQKAGRAAAAVEDGVEVINVYDVMHAAWDLHVRRLEEFAARYLAGRLEHYVDEDEFAELIRESAGRVRDRHETDTIELLDDIRYHLGERFKLRFEDLQFDKAAKQVVRRARAMERRERDGKGDDEGVAESEGEEEEEEEEEEDLKKEAAKRRVGEHKDVLETIDGAVVADVQEMEARNYAVLMQKIEELLERLKLDA